MCSILWEIKADAKQREERESVLNCWGETPTCSFCCRTETTSKPETIMEDIQGHSFSSAVLFSLWAAKTILLNALKQTHPIKSTHGF